MDNITIQSIHPEAGTMVVVFNIEGSTYPKVMPLLSVSDANLLKSQLQACAVELRQEFDAVKKQVQNANAVPQVSPDVQALEGQSIPVDTSNAGAGSITGDGSGTPGSTSSSSSTDTSGTSSTPSSDTTGSGTDTSGGTTPPAQPGA